MLLVLRSTVWLPSACACPLGSLTATPVNDKVVVPQAFLDVCSLHNKLVLIPSCAEQCDMSSLCLSHPGELEQMDVHSS